jgi:hypothetical protein
VLNIKIHNQSASPLTVKSDGKQVAVVRPNTCPIVYRSKVGGNPIDLEVSSTELHEPYKVRVTFNNGTTVIRLKVVNNNWVASNYGMLLAIIILNWTKFHLMLFVIGCKKTS